MRKIHRNRHPKKQRKQSKEAVNTFNAPDDTAGAEPHLVGLEVVGELAQPLLEFTGLEA